MAEATTEIKSTISWIPSTDTYGFEVRHLAINN
jgi:hypothetical protein